VGYSYGLFNTIDSSIDHFSKVTDTTITYWDYTLEEVHQAIMSIVPKIKWGTAEQQEESVAFWSDRSGLTPEQREAMVADIKSRDPSASGQIDDPDWGKFECAIDMVYGSVIVETSLYRDYKQWIIAIAKTLKLSAFDVQTGERIYNPYNEIGLTPKP